MGGRERGLMGWIHRALSLFSTDTSEAALAFVILAVLIRVLPTKRRVDETPKPA